MCACTEAYRAGEIEKGKTVPCVCLGVTTQAVITYINIFSVMVALVSEYSKLHVI